jgi:REP element-mobilizing transposase RayT
MQKNIIPLRRGNMYHIYNRGIAQQPIFFNKKNYEYFLSLFFKHVSPIAETFAYCLMNNHFHFLIRIKEEDDLPEKYQKDQRSFSLPLSHWCNAYAQAINKQEDRTGSLFQRPFRRILIEDERQLVQTIMYIHGNPKHHLVFDDFQHYPYSSFGRLVNAFPTFLKREEVWDYFGGKAGFMDAHEEYYHYLDDQMTDIG